MSSDGELVLELASDIKCEPLPKMDPEQFVAFDGQRIFERMINRAKSWPRTPVVYVLNSPRDLERIPPCPGVYIAFCEKGRCHYVGESACVGRRVGSFGCRDQLRDAKYIAYIEAEDLREQKALEFYYIGLLSPVYNRQLEPQGSAVPVAFYANVAWDPLLRLFRVHGNGSFISRRGKIVRKPKIAQNTKWLATDDSDFNLLRQLCINRRKQRKEAKDGR